MTTLALARVEARRLLLHPSIVVGVLLTALGYWLIHLDRAAPALFNPDTSFGFTLPLVLLAWSVMIGVTVAVLRSRREGTEELLDSLPAMPATRTGAHLLSVWAVVPLALVILALASVLAHVVMPGTIGWVPLSRSIGVLLIVVGGGASAVLLARWIPHAVIAPVGVIATLVLQANLRYKDVHLRWLHFSPGTEYAGPFDFRHDGWHAGLPRRADRVRLRPGHRPSRVHPARVCWPASPPSLSSPARHGSRPGPRARPPWPRRRTGSCILSTTRRASGGPRCGTARMQATAGGSPCGPAR